MGNQVAKGTLAGLVAGGVQAGITGEKPNWGLIAANSFGNSLGNAVVGHAVTTEQQKQQAALEQQQAKNAGQMTADLDRQKMNADLASKQEAMIAASDMTPRERAAASAQALRVDSTAENYSMLSESIDRALYSSDWDLSLVDPQLAETYRQIDLTNAKFELLTAEMDFDATYGVDSPKPGFMEFVKDQMGLRVGAVETGLSLLSSAIAEPAAGIAGLGTWLLTRGDVDASVAVIDGVRDSLTYNPKSEWGARGLNTVGTVLQPVANGLNFASSAMGDVGYNWFGPAGGAIGAAMPDLILSLPFPQVRGALASVSHGTLNGAKTVGVSLLDEVFSGPSLRTAQMGAIRL